MHLVKVYYIDICAAPTNRGNDGARTSVILRRASHGAASGWRASVITAYKCVNVVQLFHRS